jgi:Matrixin
VSILTQIRRLQGRHVHMNFIRVGSDQFTDADIAEIDAALQFTRENFAQVGLGVGRIEHHGISTVNADGLEHIESDDDAVELTDDWTIYNSALDIFFVLTYAGGWTGISAVGGPCNKDAKGMDGSVVAIENDANKTAYVLAHEAAHYLGLSHSSSSDNLMYKNLPNGGRLTGRQGARMGSHCFVQSGC